MLLAFGLDLPILGFDNDQQKLVVINEKEQYPVQKLFNIGNNLRVKQFLLEGRKISISDFFSFTSVDFECFPHIFMIERK